MSNFLGVSSVDSRETRLPRYDGFAHVLSSGGGLSGPNYQLLRACHEHHHHHHQCVLSSEVRMEPLFDLLYLVVKLVP